MRRCAVCNNHVPSSSGNEIEVAPLAPCRVNVCEEFLHQARVMKSYYITLGAQCRREKACSCAMSAKLGITSSTSPSRARGRR